MRIPALLLLSFSAMVQGLEAPEITLVDVGKRHAFAKATDQNDESLRVFLSIDQGEGSSEIPISDQNEQVLFSYSGLIPHTDYRFISQACHIAYCSPRSILEFTTKPDTPTMPVTNLRTSATENSLTVQFNAPVEANHKDGINGYQLQLFPYQAPSGCFDNHHPVINNSEAQYDFTGLSPQTDYSLCIRSVNALGPGTNSTGYLSTRLTTLAGLPAQAPEVVEIIPDKQLTIIRWTPLTHAQANGKVIQNDVRYRPLGSSEWQERQLPGNGQLTFLILSQNAEGKLYEFAVRSHTSAGPGPWSNVLGNDDNAL